jgi:hypothetical protein
MQEVRMEKSRLLTVRMSEEDYQKIVEKARLAGRSLSDLVRDSMGRVKTWTARDRASFREHTLALARIGEALGDLARSVRQNPALARTIIPELQKIADLLFQEKGS